MANPVTGPFFKAWATEYNYAFGYGYRQVKPHNLVLPYRLYLNSIRGQGISLGAHDGVFSNDYYRHDDAARNNAYAKFQSEIKESAQWGETLVQLGKTRQMLVDRVMQMTRFASQLKKGKFKAAAKTLRMPRPSGASRRKDFASNFLEYKMGWDPLVKDIYSTCEHLTSPLKGYKVSGTGSSYLQFVERQQSSTGKTRIKVIYQTTVRYKMGAYVAVTNPNLYLLSSMGVINPAATAWQAATLSFVVDWFINVEQMLLSMSDYVGLRLEMPYTTMSRRFSVDRLAINSEHSDPRFHWVENGESWGVVMRRDPGNPSPVLNFKPFRGFSPARGATAIALLLQKLR